MIIIYITNITYFKRWAPTNVVYESSMESAEIDKRIRRQVDVRDKRRDFVQFRYTNKCIYYISITQFNIVFYTSA